MNIYIYMLVAVTDLSVQFGNLFDMCYILQANLRKKSVDLMQIYVSNTGTTFMYRNSQ